ncbi:hypothetical protein FRC03_004948 [Tulasnella sp. 419]|nr:hypothetical protein FRC02_011078 [Tulasnella sp. 418]KAG8961791.1 hypothetical protein FRC03_004948 [Tulasnella sp. 419]
MGDPRAQRNAALEQLRQNRIKAGSTSSSVTSDSRGGSAQASDLTTSRYFQPKPSTSTSSDLGTVLVADSSPNSTTSSRATSYQPHLTHGVPSRAGWLSMQDNILSAPSNFMSANSSTSSLASTSKMAYAQPRRKTDDHDKDHERPRKKVNTGSSVGVPLVPDSSPLSTSSKASVKPNFASTPSSQSRQISQAREQLSTIRIASNGASSDDSSPDSLLLQDDRPSSRIARGKPQLSPESPSLEKGNAAQPIVIGSSPPQSNIIDSLTGAASKLATNGTRPKFPSRTTDDDVQAAASSPPSSPAIRRVVGGPSTSRPAPPKPTATPSSSTLDISKFFHQPRKMNIKSAIYAKRAAVEQPQDETEGPEQPPSRGSKRKLRGGVSESESDTEFKAQSARATKAKVKRDSDESEMDTEDDEEPDEDEAEEYRRNEEGVKWFNEASENGLIELTSCTPAQAKIITGLRPFDNHDDLRTKLNKKKGVSYKQFEIYREVMQGYDALDVLLKKCERFGEKVTKAMSLWGGTAASSVQPSKAGTPLPETGDNIANGSKEAETSASADTSVPQTTDVKVVIDPPAPSSPSEKTEPTLNGTDDANKSPQTSDASGLLDVKPLRPKSMDIDERSGASTPTGEEAGVHITEIKLKPGAEASDLNGYIPTQPALLSNEVQLKDYQLTGINWLNLLHTKHMSCILADEMGLGKTVQVIAFLAHLKETNANEQYRHLVIVPASTLENWVREFERFAPGISVQTYYGAQNERSELRYQLLANRSWDVLVTTYNLAQGSDLDRKFFKKIEWEVCVFDEGHVLKNYNSQRYTHLMAIRASWRLLLTGTPLQNNLQELVSLLNFIMPSLFKEHEESLRAIFKTKADSQISFLSRNRISRAKKMMTPFVLRRRKDQVLKDLPRKKEWIEYCEMTPLQRTIYREALQRSKKTIETIPEEDLSQVAEPKPKPKKKSKFGASNGDTSSNVLMDLRKASSHPMLFRRLFNDAKIKQMAKDCMKEPEFCDSNYAYVVEDMEVMTDAELQKFCKRYKSVNKHALEDTAFLDAGKIKVLLGLLENYKTQNKRVLVFSQFTQILDILESIFTYLDIKYLILTGSTAVDERQGLVDIFNEDEEISVFLLSTKAGGMGINLTAACVVIIFDQDFNPHNDKQACDRAYRIGQKRDVDVIKLVTKGTIEEDMYNLGNTKLMLDQAVATDRGDDEGESAPEKAMKASLLSVLKKKFEEEGEEQTELDTNGDVQMAETGQAQSDQATTGNDNS